MRFGLARGKHYPRFPAMMGEYLGKTNFYTSLFYLEPGFWQDLGDTLSIPEMVGLMETILFTREPLVEGHPDEHRDPVHRDMAEEIWGKPKVKESLQELRDLYMDKKECLCHGDLHTSNTMAGCGEKGQMKIIDMEYTHLGPFSADSGYLLGNLVYTYATWFFHQDGSVAERRAYREETLGYIRRTLEEYRRVFRRCWDAHALLPHRYQPNRREALLRTYVAETAGFMGDQILTRVSAPVETYDFDVLPDRESRNLARGLCLATAYNLLAGWHSLTEPEDVAGLIADTARFFMSRKGWLS
jgi:5-methylthioribose kinase